LPKLKSLLTKKSMRLVPANKSGLIKINERINDVLIIPSFLLLGYKLVLSFIFMQIFDFL
jgi:hypothetical protein